MREPARETDTIQIAHYQDENRALMEDLLYVITHPLHACEVCAKTKEHASEYECERGKLGYGKCNPVWRGVGDR